MRLPSPESPPARPTSAPGAAVASVSIRRRDQGSLAFTLLEVVLAMAMLFAFVFVLLQITATNLKVARALQRTTVDASSLAAEIALTNRLEEGVESGDFGDLHPGYEWRRETTMVGTNGLFELRFEVYRSRDPKPESELVTLLYRPDSASRIGGGRR